jgi:simple sugar transport system permease protein
VLQLPLLLAILLTFLLAGCFGALNGQIVLRTGLPSFIVTLAFLFIFRGLTLVGLKWATGGSTQMRGIREAVADSWIAPLFSGQAFTGLFAWLAERGMIDTFATGVPRVTGISVDILWFFGIAPSAPYRPHPDPLRQLDLRRRRRRHRRPQLRRAGHRVKTILFITTACCATLVAILTVMDTGSTDARRGFQKEFEAIIAAVIGGCLLTGGYGSVIGAFFGAIIFGMVLIGLTYTRIDQDWYLVFLGGMLLLAVFFNNIVRKRATGER